MYIYLEKNNYLLAGGFVLATTLSCGASKLTNHLMVCLQIGITKVFLRAGQMAELDARRAEVLANAAKAIQRRIRTHIARKHFIALREASIFVQALCRGEPFDV